MTYEYLCTACGHAWEAEQSISAAALKTCPNCHAETAKRQVSGGAGFILKGGGWYADLYGSAPKSTASSSSDGDAKPKTEGTSTKPAADTSTKGADKGSSSSDKGSSGSDKGSSGSSGASGSGGAGTPASSSGSPTSGTPSGSKPTGAASGA